MKILDDLVLATESLLHWALENKDDLVIPTELIENLSKAITAAKEKVIDPDTIKLFCHNDKCAAKGSFITRTKKLAESNVWICDMCNSIMGQ